MGTILWLSVSLMGQDKLQQEFKAPPNSAKPRVWWHWMNGNYQRRH
jgi:(4-O-methyl)-D-glucuronate---lignin esterase